MDIQTDKARVAVFYLKILFDNHSRCLSDEAQDACAELLETIQTETGTASEMHNAIETFKRNGDRFIEPEPDNREDDAYDRMREKEREVA